MATLCMVSEAPAYLELSARRFVSDSFVIFTPYVSHTTIHAQVLKPQAANFQYKVFLAVPLRDIVPSIFWHN